MQVNFSIKSAEYFVQDKFCISCSWEHPFHPRVGDKVSGLFFFDRIDPEVFYKALNPAQQVRWDEWVGTEAEGEDLTREVAGRRAVTVWLRHLDMAVTAVTWSLDGSGCDCLCIDIN